MGDLSQLRLEDRCQWVRGASNKPKSGASLKAVVSVYGIPKSTSDCLPDSCPGFGPSVGKLGEKRGITKSRSGTASSEGHTFSMACTGTREFKKSVPEVASASQPRSAQEQATAEETSCASELTTGEGEVLEKIATTMLIRNVPDGCTSTEFMNIIDLEGFKGLYDYYYQPMNYQTGRPRTYAFMNFVTPAIAKAFQIKTHGIKLYSGKHEVPPLCVCPAHEQGWHTHVVRYYACNQSRKSKRSKPFFPKVDLQRIPQAEAEAKQLIGKPVRM